MKLQYSLIICLLLVGTSSPAKQVHTVKKKIYSDGHLKSQVTYVNGKNKDAEAIYYDIYVSIIKRKYYKNEQ